MEVFIETYFKILQLPEFGILDCHVIVDAHELD